SFVTLAQPTSVQHSTTRGSGNKSSSLIPIALITLPRATAQFAARLSPFFPIAPSRSLLTLFTLRQISPVFATLTKSTPGYTPCDFPHKDVFPLSSLESILTNFRGRNPFVPHT